MLAMSHGERFCEEAEGTSVKDAWRGSGCVHSHPRTVRRGVLDRRQRDRASSGSHAKTSSEHVARTAPGARSVSFRRVDSLDSGTNGRVVGRVELDEQHREARGACRHCEATVDVTINWCLATQEAPRYRHRYGSSQ